MSDFEEKLNAILSNPDAMAQVASLAQSLGGGASQPSPPPSQEEPGAQPPPPAGEETRREEKRRGGFLDQVLERLHLEDIDKGDILLLLILLFLFDQGEDEELLMALGLLFLL